MQDRSFWSVSGMAVAASITLAACGGGELIAAVAFIGSAGGDWRNDLDPATREFERDDTCGGNPCFVNVQTVGDQNLFATRFDVTYTSNLPGCLAQGTGRIEGRRVVLNQCFDGRYESVNEVVASDGSRRMFFSFTPALAEGVWVDIEREERRFVFGSNAQGCELGTPSREVTVSYRFASVDDIPAPVPFETTIEEFTIDGDTGGAWSGRFVGVSGMRLLRGNEVLELERRPAPDPAPAC